MFPSYAGDSPRWRHLAGLVCLVTVWVGIRVGAHVPLASIPMWRMVMLVGAGVSVTLWIHHHRLWALVCVFGVSICVGSSAWWSDRHAVVGECSGVVRVMSDPMVRGVATRAVVERDEIRYRATAYGRAAWKLQRMKVGESVSVEATCSELRRNMFQFERSRHVLGLMSVTDLSEDVVSSSPLHRSTMRVREALREGVRSYGIEDRELFMGLVVGADERQSPRMIEDFRRSGLGHLTAVSGQNVSYLLAFLAMLISGWRTSLRFLTTVAFLMWFVVLTRFEPSIVRATVMACASILVVSIGRRWDARGVGPMSMAVLLWVDPLLAFNIGFHLSALAALGLLFLQTPIREALGDRRGVDVLAVTLSAQIATLPVAIGVFHRFPAVSLVANLLATPVAGLVMLIGLPLGIVGAFAPDEVATALMWPCRAMVRWVWWVAHVCARVPSHPGIDAATWSIVLTSLIRRGMSARHRYGRLGS